MIRLSANSQADEQRIVYTDYFRTQRDNILLLAEAQTHVPFFEHVERMLHEAIQGLCAKLRDAADPEPLLKEFFVQLNWRMHTLLSKTISGSESENPEHGLSLFFVLTRGDQLFAVQFGRMLSCVVKNNKVQVVGEAWENFAIRTRDQMKLIGARGEDISVKVHKLTLPKGSRFLVVSSHITEEVMRHGPGAIDLQHRLRQSGHSFAVFETEPPLQRLRRSIFRGKPFRFSAIGLIIVVIVSALYFYQCNNQVEDQLTVMRQLRQYMERNQDPERVPEMLGEIARVMLPEADTLQITRIVNEARSFVTTPAAAITLSPVWTMQTPDRATLPPAFDNHRLFVVSGTKVRVYDKQTRKLLYEVSFDKPVRRLLLGDANRFHVTTADGVTHCCKKDAGELAYTLPGPPIVHAPAPQTVAPISFVDDRRLAMSMLVVAQDGEVQVVNSLTGEKISAHALEAQVSQLSSFDPIEKALYAVAGDNIVKLWLEVR